MPEIQLSPETEIAHYVCKRVREPLIVDGSLTKPTWEEVEKSPRFVDMVTGQPGLYDTRAAMLWDDTCLYVGFWVEEPFVTAGITERDQLIFLENDVEIFIDGGDCYYEFEINALGTIYEVFFLWQDAYTKGSRWDVPEFDILGAKALSFGGDYDRTGAHFWRGTHPRGPRWAFRGWDFPGLRSAVKVQGRINDSSSVDQGWTVEVAFPWAGMHHLAGGRSLPPHPGDIWRIFCGRFEKLAPSGVEIQPHPAWCWGRHGVYDTHRPERFPYIEFSDQVIG